MPTAGHTARTLDSKAVTTSSVGEPIPAHLTEPVIFHLDNISGFIEPGLESGAAGKAAAGYIEAAVEYALRAEWMRLRRPHQ